MSELDDLERLYAGTTPGPYAECTGDLFPRGVKTDCGTCQLIAEFADRWQTLPFAKGSPKANRAFFVAAHNHFPAILKRFRELESLVADLAAWNKKYPKGRIHPIGPNDCDKQLDRLCERAAALKETP